MKKVTSLVIIIFHTLPLYSMNTPHSNNHITHIIAFDLHDVVFDFSYTRFVKAFWLFLVHDIRTALLCINPLFFYRMYRLIATHNRTAENIYDLLMTHYYPQLAYTKENFLALCNVYTLNTKMYNLIKQLKATGCTIAICSNIGQQAYTLFKKHYPKFFELCDIIVISEPSDRYSRKPQTAFFMKLKDRCTAFGDSKQVKRIIFIDDKAEHVNAAQSVGLIAHHFTRVDRLYDYLASYGFIATECSA